jgi:AsmA protein
VRVVKYVGIALVLLVLIAVAVPFLIDANTFRPRLEAALTDALGRPVRVGNLTVALWSGGVTAEDLSIADDPAYSRSPFLQAKSLKLSVELMPLIFSHTLNVTGLTIDQPAVVLLQAANGAWNFSSMGGKQKPEPAAPPPASEPMAISAKLVKITNGHFALGQANRKTKPLALDNVNIEVQNFAPRAVFPFSFSAQVAGGGKVSLDGKAGPIPESDAAMTPVETSFHAVQLDIARTGVVEPSTGMAGLISLDAQGTSNGETIALKGHLKGERLKLVKSGSPAGRPIDFDFDVSHDLRKRTGRLRRGDVHFGSAPASLTGTYDLRGETAVLNMTFSGLSMAVDELKQLLPAVDVVLPAGSSLQGGAALAKLTFQGSADRLVTTGSLGLSNTRLAGFDLGTKLKVIGMLAGIPSGPNTEIQTLGAEVKSSPEGTTIDNFRLIVPTIGQLTGAGTISPARALDFQMRVTLHTSGMVMAALGQKGDTSVPVLIGGSESNPSFKPDVKAITQQKIQGITGNSDIGKTAGSILDNLFGGKKK